MFDWLKPKDDLELEQMSDEQLADLPLIELQRIRNKRWANDLDHLVLRADQELARRDPRRNWVCVRCSKARFHEHEMRAPGSFSESFFGWHRQKFHAIICNYCGKTELYSVLVTVGEDLRGIGAEV